MSNPIDIPLSNPEGVEQDDANQNSQRKSSGMKRLLKNFSLARMFARKKASNMDGNPIAQDPAAGKLDEIHEMQVLQSDLTIATVLEEEQNIPIQEPEPQTASKLESTP